MEAKFARWEIGSPAGFEIGFPAGFEAAGLDFAGPSVADPESLAKHRVMGGLHN